MKPYVDAVVTAVKLSLTLKVHSTDSHAPTRARTRTPVLARPICSLAPSDFLGAHVIVSHIIPVCVCVSQNKASATSSTEGLTCIALLARAAPAEVSKHATELLGRGMC